MKILNIMNFVRQCEPRDAETDALLFPTTKAQLELVNELQVDNTFLLQYDALCDQRYVELFKTQATDRTEIGLWFEIVKDLTDAVGLPYRSEQGWRWDWHIIPGFPMGYTPAERERLVDEAMRKFKEVFGFYPKTFGSWVTDTHTINYLTDHYDIHALCNCRDQRNTDAYTLVGGYFNQAYYPSRRNMFTPARSEALRVNTPMFRLLGPDPIHNHDSNRYLSPDCDKRSPVYTMEVAWSGAQQPDVVDWYYRAYYQTEDMGFSYMQIGQENSFARNDLITPLRMQIEKALAIPDVRIMKMSDAGDAFRQYYGLKTPVTALAALDNWDSVDAQSIYYDSQYYTANLFRHEDQAFFRTLYLFDETIPDQYLTATCHTHDAVYENQPLVDSEVWADGDKPCGLYLDGVAEPFQLEKVSDTALKVFWADKAILFDEDRLTITGCAARLYPGKAKAEITTSAAGIHYVYRGHSYALTVEQGALRQEADSICFQPTDGAIRLSLHT